LYTESPEEVQALHRAFTDDQFAVDGKTTD
jgi:hypothetical protein